MNSQPNIELVQKAYSDFKSRNIPALLEALSQDVDWFIPGPPSVVPFAGHRRGRQQVAEFFAGLAQSQIPQEFEPQEFVGNGDKVVVPGRQRWQVKSTGHVYGDEWAHVFWIEEGKIVRFREYHDTEAEASAHRS
jgi:ketosteroid isomerase-like protein